MEVKHTPTPYSYTNCGLPVISLFGADNKGLWHKDRPDSEQEATCEFIVRAVNSHDRLVLALKRCLIRIEEECADPEYLDCVISAKEILALAEEKP